MAEYLLDAPDLPGTGRGRSDPEPVTGYRLGLAGHRADVVAAQRLRGRNAGIENAARLTAHLDGGVDDNFDAGVDDVTDHLIVWHTPSGAAAPKAVGTVRILPPHGNDAFPRGSGLLADRMFGLMPLESLLGAAVEVSGLCVADGHRRGAVIGLLATGIARYLQLTGYRFVLGMIPVDDSDGGRAAAAIWDLALRSALAPAERRCRPRDPVPIGRLRPVAPPAADRGTKLPPLLRAALRVGAEVCGPPGVNDAGRAVFLFLLDLDAVVPSRRQRLLRADS